MKRVLMVCLGNICRSPLAQGILESRVDSSEVEVDSAGTSAFHVGSPPDPRSISIAKRHNIDISKQLARRFEVDDFDKFDFIYVMDKLNEKDLKKLARNKNDISKIRLILSVITNQSRDQVPDPYYSSGDQGFKYTFKLLYDAISEIIASELNI